MKIGEKVSVIDDDLRGEIVSVSGGTIVIADEHGFHHHFPKEKLVPQNGEIYASAKIAPKPEPKKITSKKNSKNIFILDLHFEKLVENPKNFGSAERLFIQREKLLQSVEFCRRAGIKRMEIIHGVGDGVLQKLVYDVLLAQTGIDFRDKEILHHQSGAVVADLL